MPLPEGRLRRLSDGSNVGVMNGYEVAVSDRGGAGWHLWVSTTGRQWTMLCVPVESPTDGGRVGREWIDGQVSSVGTPINGRK